MNFEVNTQTKTVTLLSDIKLSEVELIKQLLGDQWGEWTLSFKPVTIVTKEIQWIPWQHQPSLRPHWEYPFYVGDVPGLFGQPSLYPFPKIWCANDHVFKIEDATFDNINSISMYKPQL